MDASTEFATQTSMRMADSQTALAATASVESNASASAGAAAGSAMTDEVATYDPTAAAKAVAAATAASIADSGLVRKMGPWIVGETLGEGGFSKVRVGTHEVTGQKVALKLLKTDALKLSASVRKQVEAEVAVLSELKHSNVLRLVAVDWEAKYTKRNGTVVPVILVVLELITGGELFEFLSSTGCFEEATARSYFHQLVAGVAHCHSHGIVHRDLKPENLLLDGSNFALKLADFGFAARMEAATGGLLYTNCGTPTYMAPEMFVRGRGYAPMPCDVWAMGVILFIMLAGFPPFQQPSASDWWFQKLVQGKYSLFW